MVEDYVLTSVPDLMRLINDQKADRPGGRGETYDFLRKNYWISLISNPTVFSMYFLRSVQTSYGHLTIAGAFALQKDI